MRQHTFRYTTAGVYSWTVDSDCVLVGIMSAKQFVLSTDPSMTLSAFNSPPFNGEQRDDMLISNDGTTQLMNLLNFELRRGEVIYLAVAASSNVQLYLQDL